MNAAGFRKAIFRSKYQFIRRHVPAYYRACIDRERWPGEALDEFNWQLRKALLAHAFEHSSFYRRKYEQAGIDSPLAIKSPDDWESLPILTRQEIAEHHDAIITVDPSTKNLIRSTTGGTTGSPITICRDWRLPREALAWRMMRWWGVDPSDNGAYVWRMRIRPGVRSAVNTMLWWPTVKLRYDSSSMTPQGIERFLRSFDKLRPVVLQGYTGAVAHIAMHMLEHGITVHRPRAIWVTSSPLSSVQRHQIEQAFGAPVYDQYGSCETTHISAQCANKSALHIHHDSVFLEFVDDSSSAQPVGTSGRILVTDLENLVFPMIRYENGDEGRALPGLCPCGLTLPLMDKVKGRVADHLRLPDGSILAGEYLTTIFDAYPLAVKQFQVRQAKDRSITVRYVPNTGYAKMAEEAARVERDLQLRVNGQVPLIMQPCDSIEHDRGKLRFVISEAE